MSGSVVLDERYARDALGRITTITETTPSGTSTTTYTYDGSDRLTSVMVDGQLAERDTYDAAGDRTSTTSPAGTVAATYDARDRLQAWGGRTYTWSADGTLASISATTGSTTFEYDELGDLRSVLLPGGRMVTYVVDADGQRVGREVGGLLVAGYLYDPAGNVVAETDGSGAVVARFAYDDQGHLALVEKGSQTYRVIVDQVGSPRLVIDTASGAIAESIDYDAWGMITHDSAPGFIPFGFAGGLVDPDTGLVHFGARDYDPSTGRWTTSDPIRFAGGDADLYRYAGDDPVNRSDPAGLGCEAVKATYSGLLGVFGGPALGFAAQVGLGFVPCQPDQPQTPSPSGPTSAAPFSCSGAECVGHDIACFNGAVPPDPPVGVARSSAITPVQARMAVASTGPAAETRTASTAWRSSAGVRTINPARARRTRPAASIGATPTSRPRMAPTTTSRRLGSSSPRSPRTARFRSSLDSSRSSAER